MLLHSMLFLIRKRVPLQFKADFYLSMLTVTGVNCVRFLITAIDCYKPLIKSPRSNDQ